MKQTNEKEWGLMIFQSTFEYLIDGDLNNDQFCELMRCIYNLRQNGELPDMDNMDKAVRLVWRSCQHTVRKSIRNANYYSRKKNGEAEEKNDVQETECPDNAKCEKEIKTMRGIIEEAKKASQDEYASLTERFEESAVEASKFATEKQRQTLIPALRVQFDKAVENGNRDSGLPEWMVKRLPEPVASDAANSAIQFIQECQELLAEEEKNQKYAEKVPVHKGIMFVMLCEKFGPFIQSEQKEKGKNRTMDEVDGCLYSLWQLNCKYKLDGYDEWLENREKNKR